MVIKLATAKVYDRLIKTAIAASITAVVLWSLAIVFGSGKLGGLGCMALLVGVVCWGCAAWLHWFHGKEITDPYRVDRK